METLLLNKPEPFLKIPLVYIQIFLNFNIIFSPATVSYTNPLLGLSIHFVIFTVAPHKHTYSPKNVELCEILCLVL